MSETRNTWWKDTPGRTPVDVSNRQILEDDTLPSDCIKHHYGENIYIHTADLMMATLLARLSSDQTQQPLFNQLIREIYRRLLDRVLAHHFPDRLVSVRTPMAKDEGAKGVWHGRILDPDTEVAIAEVARAGSIPAEEIFSILTGVLEPAHVRKDLLVMGRKTDKDQRVTGTDCSGSKIGGSIQGRLLLIPEPMCATGSTIDRVLAEYDLLPDGNSRLGEPDDIIVIALIVTPEFLKRMYDQHRDVIVHAVRLDRANSSARALDDDPGLYKEEESGLNRIHYIVPGAGGVGERETNSFI